MILLTERGPIFVMLPSISPVYPPRIPTHSILWKWAVLTTALIAHSSLASPPEVSTPIFSTLCYP
jgi:hypothetical protein